jgi:hypothetical protein
MNTETKKRQARKDKWSRVGNETTEKNDGCFIIIKPGEKIPRIIIISEQAWNMVIGTRQKNILFSTERYRNIPLCQSGINLLAAAIDEITLQVSMYHT